MIFYKPKNILYHFFQSIRQTFHSRILGFMEKTGSFKNISDFTYFQFESESIISSHNTESVTWQKCLFIGRNLTSLLIWLPQTKCCQIAVTVLTHNIVKVKTIFDIHIYVSHIELICCSKRFLVTIYFFHSPCLISSQIKLYQLYWVSCT